jgi:putative transposase
MVQKAEDYPWSSARVHINNKKDSLIDNNFLIAEIKGWAAFLDQLDSRSDLNLLRRHVNTGRPLGDGKFVAFLEQATGRSLQKQKSGPKAKVVKRN